MRLYHSPTTPFGRKVMLMLLETGQAQDVEIVTAIGTPLDPGTMPLDQNPLGKIPTLVLDDGRIVYDSRVICRYLDDRAGGRLYPAGDRLWDTLTLEATADGLIEAAILVRYETHVRPSERQFAGWIDAQWGKVTRALDVLETRWADHLAGPLDMGHLAAACALSYLDFRFADRAWRTGRGNLACWHEAISRRDSLQATEPKA